MNSDTQHLRQSLRHKRRQLGVGAQIASAKRLADVITELPIYAVSRHIAFYLANDGEINLLPLLKQTWRQGKHCYLPVIDGDQLTFVHFTPGAPLASNQYGIPEPTAGRQCPLAKIDLVLVPLVAFDHHGNRLGMGGGFYDRTFASQLGHDRRLGDKQPALCGVGHSFQQVASLTPQKWDFPLDWVAVG